MRFLRLSAFAGAVAAALSCTVLSAEPLRVFAAGSLKGTLEDLIAAAHVARALPVFGPAGLLKNRLANGEVADLFLSADLAGPDSLLATRKARSVVPFASNRLCLIGRGSLPEATSALVEKLLLPGFRLAISTPEADPGGDYALAVFRRASAVHPGADALLEAKAMRLLGTPKAMVAAPGSNPIAAIFIDDRADALLYYCNSEKAAAAQVPDLIITPLPPDLAVPVMLGLALLSTQPEATEFAAFILSEHGQDILRRHGFEPPTTGR